MTSVETAIPSLTRRISRDSFQEPRRDRPLREEELMQFQKTKQLLPHIASLARSRFPFHAQQLMGSLEIMETQYEGHPPRRDGTEASLHPARSLYRALRANPDLTLVQGSIIGLHDTPEDCGLGYTDLKDLLVMHQFSPHDARLIAYGAIGLSRIENGGKLSQEEYLQKLEAIHWDEADLKIIEDKAIECSDNVSNDIWLLLTDPESIDPTRVIIFLNQKATGVLDLAKKYAPLAPNTKILERSLIISRELVNQRMRTIATKSFSTDHVRV